jgi:hypothetical protein
MDGMTIAPDLSQIAAQMESIGRNCEFGAIQQQIGIQPISLLRWAGTPLPSLIDGLRNRFDGLVEKTTGRVTGEHWWLTCNRYGILFHTHESVAEKTVEQATATVRQRIRWLAAKLIEDIKAGEKLFVFSDATMFEPEEALDLLGAMRSLGGSPWLLAAVQNPGMAGTTARMADGLIGSRMDFLTAMGAANMHRTQPWLTAIADAHEIWTRSVYRDQVPSATASQIGPPKCLPATFDPAGYLVLNPDVAAVGMNPAEHFLEHGWREGRRWAAVG